MIRRYRVIPVGGYVGGVYRPLRLIRVPYWVQHVDQDILETVAPGVGEIVVTGNQPTLQRWIQVGTSDVVVTGNQPTLQRRISVGTAEVVVTGNQPNIQKRVQVGAAEVVVTGNQPLLHQRIAVGTAEVIVTGLQPSLQRHVSVGTAEVLVTGNGITILDENSIAPSVGEVVVIGNAVTLSLTGVPVQRDEVQGSGGEFEWFERRNREDEVILGVIAEFLKQAA